MPPPTRSTLFPYTTLFRSRDARRLPRVGRGDAEAPRGRGARRARRAQGGDPHRQRARARREGRDRKSTRLNSSHTVISYAVFCLKKKKVTAVSMASSRSAS